MSILTQYKGALDGTRTWHPKIWANCPWEDYAARGGALLFQDDFDTFYADGNKYDIVGDTATDIHMAGSNLAADTLGGVLELEHDSSTDNDELYLELGIGAAGAQSGFQLAAGKKTWFEAIINLSTVTDDLMAMAVGMAEPAWAAADALANNTGALTDKDFVGFNILNADSDALRAVYNTASGGGVTQHGSDQAVAIDTWYSVGFYSDGTTLWMYLDGTEIDADGVLLTATNVPNSEHLVPVIGYKMGTGSGSGSVFLDGWRACTEK